MAKVANVIIRTEEAMDEEVDDEVAEEFVKRLWEERFKSVGFDREYEIEVESFEER